MMLRDYVIDERYYDVETEQHEQPLTDEDGNRPEPRDETPHNKTVYTLETRI